MKTSTKIFSAGIVLLVSSNSFAIMELPFCPAGGPPGWFNYFSDRHDRNSWQRQNVYPMSYPPASYSQGYSQGRYPNHYPVNYPANYNYRPDNRPPVIQRNDADNNRYPRYPAQNYRSR